MKQKLMFSLRLAVLAMLGVGSIPATAQTTANGPYYPTPAWDQKLACTALNACPRFVVLSNWNSEAVLDRETGLVWERSPSTTVEAWQGALATCTDNKVGNRMGWRLPTIQELASLLDPTVPYPGPTLPAGHPFNNVQVPTAYWSANTFATDSSFAWWMRTDFAHTNVNPKVDPKNVWCVRGGQGTDLQ